MSDSNLIETSQEVESPVLVSGQSTLVPEDEHANADEDLVSDAEHADGEKSQETTVIVPGDHMPIPAAIVSMMNNGVEFSRTKDCWHLGEDNVSLKKPFSVYFSLDTPCTHYDVAEGLLTLGIDYDDISSIQRRLASNLWVIAFRTAEAKYIAQLRGCECFSRTATIISFLLKFTTPPTKCLTL